MKFLALFIFFLIMAQCVDACVEYNPSTGTYTVCSLGSVDQGE